MENIYYYLEYTDIKGVTNRLNIYSSTYVGSPILVKGAVELTYADTKDVLECVRGNGLRVSLDANTDLDFSDLYTENERTFRVEYLRDDSNIFNGWLTPDGLYEDFVADKWIISLDCVDGLGFLKNLSFVDANGFNFTGNQKELDIVANALKRTGLNLNINTNIDIYYSGLTETLDILDNTFLNTNRFIKDDDDTIMDCEEVLRSVLEPYGACITQLDGEWYIYKPNTLYDNSEATFFRYDKDGVALTPSTKTIDFEIEVGSDINNFYPCHANSNQSFKTESSLGAYRVNYKYGLVKSFLSNELLSSSGGVIDDWTINSTTYFSIPASELGFNLDVVPTGDSVLNLTSDVITVVSGDLISYEFRYTTTIFDNVPSNEEPLFYYTIKLTGTSDTYYLGLDGWQLTSYPLTDNIPTVVGETRILKVEPEAVPIDGDITIQIYTPFYQDNATGATVEIYVKYLSLYPQKIGNDSNIKGEFHTIQRKNYFTSKIENVKEIYNGDNGTDAYLGTIYETDGTTPTTKWNRKGVTESKPLLQIMVEERIRLLSKPSRIFTGDIYGFVNYLSIFKINGFNNIFMPIALSYNSVTNITSITVKEIFNDSTIETIYELTFDYGNVVKPTIKG